MALASLGPRKMAQCLMGGLKNLRHTPGIWSDDPVVVDDTVLRKWLGQAAPVWVYEVVFACPSAAGLKRRGVQRSKKGRPVILEARQG